MSRVIWAKDITHAMASALFKYDPDSGHLYRKLNGDLKRVENRNKLGYIQTSIKSIMVPAHRLAWLLQTGEWPSGVIDHVNRIRDDNRWENLRDVDRYTNMKNSEYWENTRTFKGGNPKYARRPTQLELTL